MDVRTFLSMYCSVDHDRRVNLVHSHNTLVYAKRHELIQMLVDALIWLLVGTRKVGEGSDPSVAADPVHGGINPGVGCVQYACLVCHRVLILSHFLMCAVPDHETYVGDHMLPKPPPR